MSSQRLIELVAPPFAGHLFPDLGLLKRAKHDSRFKFRCLTTNQGLLAVQRAGIEGIELLAGKESQVLALANQPGRIGANPGRALAQFREQLALMKQLLRELEMRWQSERPDLVLVDFAVPFAGMLAERMGIRWWSCVSAPSVFETRSGPPTYLGGWREGTSWLYRLRDRMGRSAVSTFKRTVALAFQRSIRSLGFAPTVYRADGSEVLYSNERVLMLGMRELEFERGWPPKVEFVGPVSNDPGRAGNEPTFDRQRTHCLISHGTHVPWAKRRAAERFRRIAQRMPDWTFDFSWGNSLASEERLDGNWREFSFVSYDRFLQNYDVVVHHAGIGVSYAAVAAGIPALVSPQDFDQFDHATRLVQRGLAVRVPRRDDALIERLKELVEAAPLSDQLAKFRSLHRHYDAAGRFQQLLEQAFSV